MVPRFYTFEGLGQNTHIQELKLWRAQYSDHVHVAYINSSAEHKAIADWIVTSKNADDIISFLYSKGEKVVLSPDRNIGAYLNSQYGYNMPLWTAVCEVHDNFNEIELEEVFSKISGEKYLIAHPESPLPVLKKADFIGATSSMLNWIKTYSGKHDALIMVATEEGMLYNMKLERPELNIRQAPMYTGCKCNVCPYMAMNKVELIKKAQIGIGGYEINYLSNKIIEAASLPINRMIEFSQNYYG